MKILIEKTPAYFVKSYVPRRIFFFNPSVKLIVLLRNPLDRLISDYDQVISFVSLCVCVFFERGYHVVSDFICSVADQQI